MSHPSLDIIKARLEEQARLGLARALTGVGPSTGVRVRVRGRDCLLLASNDYLGLSGHPRLIAAAKEAAVLGAGSGASRLVSGTLDSHVELEEAIARFKGAESAVYLATGYMTNLAAVAGLAGPGDLVVSDALNHASIIDACRLSRAEVRVYAHGDAAQAAELLTEGPDDRLKLLVTDGVFSMHGDLAPLAELYWAARDAGALLVVDDAHATGVWGHRGRGTVEHFGLEGAEGLVMVGTFSKALGCFGGFVAGPKEVIDLLVHRARSLLYTTAPPPAQAAAAKESLAIIDQEPWRRQRLYHLSKTFRDILSGMGFELLSAEGPIIPVLVGENQAAVDMAQRLWERGVYAPAMRPPTVPVGQSMIRLSITAAHDESDLETAARALEGARQEAGL